MNQTVLAQFESLESRTLLHTGTLDVAFNDGKLVSTDFPGTGGTEIIDLATLGDGSILAAGIVRTHNKNGLPTGTQLALARYNFDGSLNSGFGENGMIAATPRGMAIGNQLQLSPDGGFFILGGDSGFNPFILKFTAAGKVDSRFGNRGALRFVDFGDISGFAVDSEGRVLVATSRGSDALLRRFAPDGSVDMSFNDGRDVLIPPVGAVSGTQFRESRFGSIQLDRQGRILVLLNDVLHRSHALPDVVRTDRYLYRISPAGKGDASFGSGGKVALPDASGPQIGEVLGDGKITIITTDRALRFNDNGSVDKAYGKNGSADLEPYAIRGVIANSFTVAPDGSVLRILNGATLDTREFSLQRLNADGSKDMTFGNNGKLVLSTGGEAFTSALTVAPDGTIVVGGVTGTISPSGKVDTRAFTLGRFYNGPGPAVQVIPRTLKSKTRYLSFSVLIRDDEGVRLNSLDDKDLKLFDAAGKTRKIRLLRATAISDTYVQAVYRIIGPGSTSWSAAANGTYEVRLQRQQIFDTENNAAMAQILGIMRVKIK